MASRRTNRSKSNWQRRRLVLLGGAIALLVAACGGGGDKPTSTSSSGGAAPAGNVEITMWHGYGELAAPGEEPNTELDSLKAQVDAFQVANPNIKVDMTYVNSDDALEKLTVALQGDKAPDVTYQYGTNLPQLATSPKVVDLTERVERRRLQLERLPGRRARRVHHRRQGVSACPRWSTTSRSSTTRTCSPRPGWPSRSRTGRGTSWSPTPRR